MSERSSDHQCAANTDRELWREREGDYYADSIHVTAQGGIGIKCGGYVYVKPIREWFKLAGGPFPAVPDAPVFSNQLVAVCDCPTKDALVCKAHPDCRPSYCKLRRSDSIALLRQPPETGHPMLCGCEACR